MKSNDLLINIITELKGTQNLKQGEKQIGLLEASAKKLGHTLASVFAVGAVVAFGKASLTAFMEDNKQAAILNQTLKNLGQGYAALSANDYLTKLSEQTGIVKDNLLPAYDTLARSTKDAAKAQELLNLAVDVSAGTGKDLGAVSSALAKSYGGNTAALGRLATGISQADLKSKDFKLIQDRLTQLFKGDAKTAADTYAGSVDRLKASFHEMQVEIGQGLTQAFINLAGAGGGIDNAQSAMQTFGDVVSQELAGLGAGVAQLGKDILKIPGLGALLKKSAEGWDSVLGITDAIQADKMAAFDERMRQGTKAVEQFYKDQARQLKIAKEIAAQEKAAADAKAKADAAAKKAKAEQLALEKASAALKMASKVTDLSQIEIQAALQGKISDDEKNRLLLQRALLDNNASAATLLAEKVLLANGLVMDVNGNILKLGTAKDPFAGFPDDVKAALEKIAKVQEAINALKGKTVTITVNTVTTGTSGTVTLPDGSKVNPSLLPPGWDGSSGSPTNPSGNTDWLAGLNSSQSGGQVPGGGAQPMSASSAPTVNIYNNGSVIYDKDLAQQVQDAINNNTASGNQSFSRLGRVLTAIQ